MADQPSNIRGPLIDLDGVLYVGGDVIPGAKVSMDESTRMGIQRRYVTNTTTRTAAAVASKPGKTGFDDLWVFQGIDHLENGYARLVFTPPHGSVTSTRPK